MNSRLHSTVRVHLRIPQPLPTPYGSTNCNEGGRTNTMQFQHRYTKLDFPCYAGTEPTEWLHQANKFFRYQNTLEDQCVLLASFHMDREANQWLQWLQRTYKADHCVITWDVFEQELLARFGPIEYEGFDEALSKIEQTGSLRDYQCEFECLANRVVGWPQKALIGTSWWN